MALVARIRASSGYTQAELAARAGTSRTRLSAYEHERTDPGLETLQRLAAAADLELALVAKGSDAVRDRVAAMRASLGNGDAAHALRLLAELADQVRSGDIAFDALLVDPGSTGDRRWDAFVGGVAELLATELGRVTPAWSAAPGRMLDEVWFVSRRRSVRPFVFVETPAPLAARNVFVSAASLRGV
jgi:transcriptional regulator with XRE-family HTH domain